MRILVVDDDTSIRLLVRRFLSQEFRLDYAEAGDGASALEYLSHHTVDVVVLDLHLPDMDGVEALQSIRSSAQFQNLPVVLLTGRPYEEPVRRAVKLGIAAVVLKPFTKDELCSRLRPLLASAAHKPDSSEV